MDRKVVMLNDLNKLQYIATLATITTLEFDHFIRLAMTVEQYIQNQSQETFTEMYQSLSQCVAAFPKYNESRQALLSTLVESGFIQQVNLTSEDTSESDSVTETPSEIEGMDMPKNNVVHLFGSVDKKK